LRLYWKEKKKEKEEGEREGEREWRRSTKASTRISICKDRQLRCVSLSLLFELFYRAKSGTIIN
jgi:hypothetical protein